jgi:hypothetical protein
MSSGEIESHERPPTSMVRPLNAFLRDAARVGIHGGEPAGVPVSGGSSVALTLEDASGALAELHGWL